MGDDEGHNERREEKVNISHRQLRDLDSAAQGLDNAVHALFKDVVGFGGIDLSIVAPSDSTIRLSENVREAKGSAKTWPDGNLIAAKSRQDLRRWSNQCQPRCSKHAHVINPENIASLVLTQQCEIVIAVPWDTRLVCPGGVLFDLFRQLHRIWVPLCAWVGKTNDGINSDGGWRIVPTGPESCVMCWSKLR